MSLAEELKARNPMSPQVKCDEGDYCGQLFLDLNIKAVQVSGVSFAGAQFDNCKLTASVFTDCDFTDSEFFDCTIADTEFVNCTMTRVMMWDCYRSKATMFDNCLDSDCIEIKNYRGSKLGYKA